MNVDSALARADQAVANGGKRPVGRPRGPRKVVEDGRPSSRSDGNQMSLRQRQRASKLLKQAVVATFPDRGTAALAKKLKLSRQAVDRWYVSGVVPATRVVDVIKCLKGMEVEPKQLRPDVFK